MTLWLSSAKLYAEVNSQMILKKQELPELDKMKRSKDFF
jgi:hypothetical protein